jgi:hypothetical protein
MIPALCIADRVPARECPCEQCRKVIAAARQIGKSMRRRLDAICLEVLEGLEER